MAGSRQEGGLEAGDGKRSLRAVGTPAMMIAFALALVGSLSALLYLVSLLLSGPIIAHADKSDERLENIERHLETVAVALERYAKTSEKILDFSRRESDGTERGVRLQRSILEVLHCLRAMSRVPAIDERGRFPRETIATTNIHCAPMSLWREDTGD